MVRMELPILEATTKESDEKIAKSIILYHRSKAPDPLF